MAERFNAPVLKTGGRKPSWVRIPPPPLSLFYKLFRHVEPLPLRGSYWVYANGVANASSLAIASRDPEVTPLPTRKVMMETSEKVLYVRMPELLHRRLRVAAALRGRSLSELAREAVERYLEDAVASDG